MMMMSSNLSSRDKIFEIYFFNGDHVERVIGKIIALGNVEIGVYDIRDGKTYYISHKNYLYRKEYVEDVDDVENGRSTPT